MRRKSFHCKSLVLGYYPILPEMFWSSGFLIFRRKNRWKMIFDGSYGKLFSRSFSFYFLEDFSIHSFLNNSWGNFVYKRNQGVECHGNHRTQLYQMHRASLCHCLSLWWPKFRLFGKKSKNTFGFLRPTAEIDFPFFSWGVWESW